MVVVEDRSLGSDELPSSPPRPRTWVVEDPSSQRDDLMSLGQEEYMPNSRIPLEEGSPPDDPSRMRLVGSQESLPAFRNLRFGRGYFARGRSEPVQLESVQHEPVQHEQVQHGSTDPEEDMPPTDTPLWARSYVEDMSPHASTSNEGEAPVAHGGDIPITDLKTHHLKCRLLIQPRDPSDFRADPSHSEGRRENLRRRGVSGPNAAVQCIVVTPGIEEAQYIIKEPLHCRLCYDSESDQIAIVNEEPWVDILIRQVVDTSTSTDQEQPADAVVLPLCKFQVGPGAWAVRSRSAPTCAFQFIVYPRTLSLSLLPKKIPPSVAGSKRNHDNSEKHAKNPAPETQYVIRTLANLRDVKKGDIVQVAEGDVEQYQIHHLGKIGPASSSSAVYTAKVSKYPAELVAVKYIKGKDPVARARMWQKEFMLHSQLNCEKIVPLLGGDARLSSLYLRLIDAHDLSHRSWRDPMSYSFKGDQQDAMWVLIDMVKALEHMAEHGIVHHDIRPANIIYDKKHGAKLIDFGNARKSDTPLHDGGSPWYIPPEYLKDEAERGPPEDVWALGIVLLYLMGLVPLPESGSQVATWSIPDAREPHSGANRRMKQWHEIVETVARDKLEEDNFFHTIVKRMLDATSERRIVPSEIREALHAKDIRMATALTENLVYTDDLLKKARQKGKKALEKLEEQKQKIVRKVEEQMEEIHKESDERVTKLMKMTHN
ncbi:kinase-like domain-containing protein [Nemania sp. NC0429]|nr:kinase-like domain-containing protein [Nemania sp. NC0429]